MFPSHWDRYAALEIVSFRMPSVPGANSLLYANALMEHGVPFSLHIYPEGPRGLATVYEQTQCFVGSSLSCGRLAERGKKMASDPMEIRHRAHCSTPGF